MTISQRTKGLCVVALLVLLSGWCRSEPLTDGYEHENVLSIRLAGDIVIGGLFPVHEDGSAEGSHCGQVKPDKGIQRMEAML
ncbi:unnamed protein product, partial [Soboliphyme baturini]|uniref:Glutamate receptor n=1 Tax=Soboliphyme baturini TaxID=241478 RepID=A0A183IAD8_9BILA